jgi:hypothetical protein
MKAQGLHNFHNNWPLKLALLYIFRKIPLSYHTAHILVSYVELTKRDKCKILKYRNNHCLYFVYRVNKTKARWEGLCLDFHCILHKITRSISMMFIMGGLKVIGEFLFWLIVVKQKPSLMKIILKFNIFLKKLENICIVKKSLLIWCLSFNYL